ncbi:deoxyribose-phosphate aldolase [Lentilactobacillus buchneri ATCC 11577]|nr:deoxyribose-phosphate aldolase [Lentilactobacillus buchneri ATCC 11577]
MRKKALLANEVDSFLLNTTFIYALKCNLGDDFFQATILFISLRIDSTQYMEILLGWSISADEMTKKGDLKAQCEIYFKLVLYSCSSFMYDCFVNNERGYISMDTVLTTSKLAKYLDHTNLKPNATQTDIKKTCEEAIKYNTASVCINSYWIPFVADQLKNSSVKPITVVGFPLGATNTETKVFEAVTAMDQGAEEIDMVLNIGQLIDGDRKNVTADISKVAEAVHAKGKLLKVILETSYLNDTQIVMGCHASMDAGADFVKTSTGFSSAGAKIDDVALMRKTVGSRLGVKASGGIHTRDEALAMINAGANRLGVSSTIAILSE